ncbi:cell division protein FtsA [candidate division WWE3 bacterium RIFCSPLOWO2_01_FULL_39_13]|uniref:Cell division protein FtsA n=1 Tax=candidate division WWE3 bacterium RIFCSPLOWO2_01_FULL_39_13 TaxID=1802624 RepID=A0A1F4V2A2_UNCKA|nr:MAG: cell division protein FtsA [candidate division WWE3 bacterium RIFCSPLOWO2_01_FULL_39_13]
MPKDQVIVALDVGSSKISCVVATVDKSKLSVIGAYSCPSRGIKNGVVNNIDKAVECISETLTKAEMMSGHPISRVVVTVTGTHIESMNSHGVVAVSGENSEISAEDIARVNEAAQAISLPSSREIIHVLPREYVVDKQGGIFDPTGMSGVRLEVEANIIHGSSTAIKNLTKCIHQVGVEVEQLIYSGLASSESVLTDTEKELGTILIDVGGGTMDLMIFTYGRPSYSAVLPIGGQDVTNDLAIGLRSLLEDAEKVKLRMSTDDLVKEREVLIDKDGHEAKVPKNELYVGDLNIPVDTVPKNLVNDIMFRRLEEAFKFVQLYIKKAGYDKKIPAGIVLTGGVAETKGIDRIVSDIFKLPVRVGCPTGISGLVDQIQGPANAAAIGAIKFVSDMMLDENRTTGHKSGNIIFKVVSFIKSFLP